jgi:hypothetical protein
MTPMLLLAATLSTAEAKDPVQIRPQSVENFDMNIAGGSFDVQVSAQRTGWLPIKLKELDYSIMVAGQEFASDTVEYDGMWIGRKEATTIPIHVEFNMAQALSVGLAAMGGKKLRVRVKGTADARVLFFPVTVKFNERID